MNIDKEFVPYEIALSIKELGFNELCFSYYDYGILEDVEFYKEKDNGHVIAPLYQQAFRWFRDNNTVPHIEKNENNTYWFTINGRNYFPNHRWLTYEEAQDACLRKLIEIVNQKQR